MRPHLRLLLAFALLLPTLLLTACGGGAAGGGTADPDPARAMPAGVAFYAEGVLRPDDEQAGAIVALSTKVARIDDPGQRIIQELESGSDKKVDYEKDIKPWLGRRAAVGVTSFDDRDGRYLGVAGVKDTGKARAFIEKTTKGDPKSVDGTDYWTDDDTLVALAGDYLLLADRVQELKLGIAQAKDEKGSLAKAKAFGDATGDLPDGRLGTFYVNTDALLSVIEKDPGVASSGGGPLVRQTFGSLKSIAGALTATESSALLETRVNTDGRSSTLGLLGPGQAPGIVREAPADSIAVYGLKDLGGTLKTTVQTFGGAFGGAAIQSQLSGLGIDIDRDVFSWIGDVAVFVRGSSLQDVDGAVMVDAKDAGAAAQALPRLIALAGRRGGVRFDRSRIAGADQAWSATVSGAPKPVVVARRGARVAIGFGEDAARTALTPSATLDASGAYDRAKQATGGLDPSWLVDIQKVSALAERSGSTDAGFRQARPYLDALGLAVAGGKREGGSYVSRVAVTTAD